MSLHCCWAFLCGLCLLTIGSSHAAEGQRADYYVAPDGRDSWSGTLPAPNAAGTDGPFATLQRAQAEVRLIRARPGRWTGATVHVRAGTYEFHQPFVLGPEDSGAEAAPLVYRAHQDEKPVLVGARQVSGLRPFRGEILQCDLKGTELEGVAFRQLFFRGERMVMARYPNVAPDDPHGGTWAHILAVDGPHVKNRFTCTDDVEKNWTNVQHAEVCIHPGHDWAWNIIPIKSVDRARSEIALAKNTSYDLRIGDRYFVQSLLEELDSPGEWYLDRGSSVLYFWPPADLAEGDLLAPVTDTVIRMEGAQHITVRGFTIQACDGDAVQIRDCDSCLIAGSVIRNCGGWAVSIAGGKDSGAFGNDICFTGHGGISVNGGDRKTLERGDNFATNNYVHHVARFWITYRPGVSCRGVGNLVSHNLIHDTPHAGLLLHGNENLVEFNHVHHTNLGSADTGGIYFCSRDWTQRGNIIRHNIFHHLGGFGKSGGWDRLPQGRVNFEYPHFTWGIYLDDPTTGTLVYGNILWSVPIRGLHNHGGRDNTFENNIIVDCPALRAGALRPNWSEWPKIYKKLHAARYEGSPYLEMYPELAGYAEDHPEQMSGLRFVRNIVYFTEEGTRWLRQHYQEAWQGGQEVYSLRMREEDWPTNEFDFNLLCAPEDMDLKFSLQWTGRGRKLLTWDQWRELGADEHSILDDPLFVDPEGRDYRLRPGSPAFDLGFEQIPVEEIGPYQHELRASWPIEEASGVSRLGDFTTARHFQLPGYEPVLATEFQVRSGAPNFFAKLAAGQPVKIAYFGGGIHPADGWRAQVLDALRDRHPGVEISELDASICDCVRGSGFSVFRFEHDVLRREPDLVLVDFASADHRTDVPSIWRAIEGVVRQAGGADPTLDLIFLYAFRSGFEPAYAEDLCPSTVSAYEKLADHYGIPSINMGYHIAKMAREGDLVIKPPAEEGEDLPGKVVFSNEGVRPTAGANEVYASAIAAALAEISKAGEVGPHELGEPFGQDNLERAKLHPIMPAMLEGAWRRISPDDVHGRNFSRHFDELWFTDTPGATLTFKFRGTHAGVFNLMGPDGGRVKVTVDGQDAGTRQQVDRWCWYHRLARMPLATGLDDGEHTITVELLPDPPDRTVPIEEAKKLNKYQPGAFEGVALYFAWLRIVGELTD